MAARAPIPRHRRPRWSPIRSGTWNSTRDGRGWALLLRRSATQPPLVVFRPVDLQGRAADSVPAHQPRRVATFRADLHVQELTALALGNPGADVEVRRAPLRIEPHRVGVMRMPEDD